MDHRLAFVLLSGLVVGAGAPLAMCWARLLPEDVAPFGRPGKTTEISEANSNVDAKRERRSNRIAVVLLVLVTISYALQFPGVPREAVLQRMTGQFMEPLAHSIVVGTKAFFAFVAGLAACYSLLWRNVVRVPLVAASILILLLWLLGPRLYAALLTS